MYVCVSLPALTRTHAPLSLPRSLALSCAHTTGLQHLVVFINHLERFRRADWSNDSPGLYSQPVIALYRPYINLYQPVSVSYQCLSTLYSGGEAQDTVSFDVPSELSNRGAGDAAGVIVSAHILSVSRLRVLANTSLRFAFVPTSPAQAEL